MEDDSDLIAGFIEEAQEHMGEIESTLLTLEDDPEDMDLINLLFRAVHSMKGGAGFLGFTALATLSHSMENLLSLARESKLLLQSPHINALLSGFDQITQMLDDLGCMEDLDIAPNLEVLKELSTGGAAAPKASEEAPVVEAATNTESMVVTLNISAKELEEVQSNNQALYASTINYKSIAEQERNAIAFLEELQEMGNLHDSLPKEDALQALPDDLSEESGQLVLLFSSIMSPALFQEVLALEEKQVAIVPLKDVDVSEDIALDFNVVGEQISLNDGSEPAAPVAEAATPEAPKKEETPPPAKKAVAPAPEKKAASKEDKKAKKAKKAKAVAKDKKVKPTIEESVRVPVSRLNSLVDLAGELVLVRNQTLRFSEPMSKQVPGLGSILQNLDRVTTELQEEIMNTRMQQVGKVFGKFPRVIRQLATDLGKQITLVSEGNEVELDKTIIEALSDPMTHIVRNTADHGIEFPDEREKAGKPTTGVLTLKAFHESGQVIIRMSDDGRGINPRKVSQIAINKGVVTEEQVALMSEKDKINLVMAAGFSTAEKVSSVSGRGVGMDVVRSNIEQIGGTIDLTSVFGEGTTITMTLPLTMAIISSLIVESEKMRFAFPQVNIEEMVILNQEDMQEMTAVVQGKKVLRLRGNLVPLISLQSGLNIPKAEKEKERKEVDGEEHSENMQILIVKAGFHRVGIIVDAILESEEIVVKPMPDYLSALKSFSGTTILGDGTVSMIMDITGFINKNELILQDSGSPERRTGRRHIGEDGESLHESQSLLIFDNGSEENFAFALPWIQRVDQIQTSSIQHIGSKEYVNHRGAQMRLLRLEDYLPIQHPEIASEEVSVIIPKNANVPVGILINKVIDTRNEAFDMEKAVIDSEGILGSTLINGKITLILDVHAIMRMGEPDSVDTPKKTFGHQRILLAEDTPFFRVAISDYLTSSGYEVVTAVDGAKALAQLQAGECFDLVLTDIEMPEMNGWELLREIRSSSEWKNLPVLAITSLSSDEDVAAGKKAGFNDWMIKMDRDILINSLSEHLN